MFGSRRETIEAINLTDGRVNRVEISIRHGYGFTSRGRGTIKTKREYIVFIGSDPVFGCTQHGDLTRTFTNKAEALRYSRRTRPIESENQNPIRIVHNASDSDLNAVGIHLSDATQWDFQDALEVAERDMFPAIYIHSYHPEKLGEDTPDREAGAKLALVGGAR